MGKLVVGGTRFLLLCALGLVLSLLVPTKTIAFGESISVSPSSGPTGQAVTIVGTGWRDHAVRGIDVPIWIGFANVVGRGLPDANGNFSVGITIPVNPPPQEIVNGKLRISAIIGNGGSADAFYTIGQSSLPPPSVALPPPPPPPSAPPGQAPQPSNLSFNVDSTKGWQTTSLKVTKGQQLSFSADGSWTVDFRNFQQVGPDGHPPDVDRTIFQGCKLESILPYGVLLVRIGDNDPHFIAIGSEETLTAYQDGFLQFRIHDGDACLGDNDGLVAGRVTIESPECPVSSINVDNSLANGVVSGEWIESSPCNQAVLEVKNNLGYWVNFKLSTVGEVTVSPAGGDLKGEFITQKRHLIGLRQIIKPLCGLFAASSSHCVLLDW